MLFKNYYVYLSARPHNEVTKKPLKNVNNVKNNIISWNVLIRGGDTIFLLLIGRSAAKSLKQAGRKHWAAWYTRTSVNLT